MSLLALAVPARAEHPTGPEVRLNATTTGEQRLSDLDTAADGRFVAVWKSQTSAAAPRRIVARVFGPDLRPKTGEIIVATVPKEARVYGRLGLDKATGAFVVAWSTLDSSLVLTGLFARRFSALGASLGPTMVLGGPASKRGLADVARSNSQFVVIWQQPDGLGTPDAQSYDIFGRKFSGTGAPVGPIFGIVGGPGSQQSAEADMNASGRFAVAFEHQTDGVGGLRVDVGVASFAANTAPVLPPTLLTTHGKEEGPGVAIANDDRIFVEWSDDGIDPPDEFGHGIGVLGIIVRENGSVLAGPGRVNVFLPEIQAAGNPVLTHTGGFLASWISFTQDGSGVGVYGRQVSPVGALGGEFRVNSVTAFNQFDLHYGLTPTGNGVAGYSTFRGATGYDVVVRKVVP
jgi:hypothetical protein